MRSFSLLRFSFVLAFISAFLISSAAANNPFIDVLNKVKRQATTSRPTTTPPVTTPTTTPTPTTPTTAPTTPTPNPTTTPPTTTAPTPIPEPSTTTPSSTPTTSPTSRVTTTSPIIQSTTVLSTTVFVTTNSDNVVITATSVRSLVTSSTAGFATVTSNPNLGSGGDGGGGGGLSSKSKAIIGGVVGGVGGAILLAGIAIVFWRMKRKNRYNPNEDLDYTAGTGQGLGSSTTGSNVNKDDGILANDNDHETRYTSQVRPNAAANF